MHCRFDDPAKVILTEFQRKALQEKRLREVALGCRIDTRFDRLHDAVRGLHVETGELATLDGRGEDVVNVRTGPSTQGFRIQDELPPGTQVTLERKLTNPQGTHVWYEIGYWNREARRVSGFVYHTYVVPLRAMRGTLDVAAHTDRFVRLTHNDRPEQIRTRLAVEITTSPRAEDVVPVLRNIGYAPLERRDGKHFDIEIAVPRVGRAELPPSSNAGCIWDVAKRIATCETYDRETYHLVAERASAADSGLRSLSLVIGGPGGERGFALLRGFSPTDGSPYRVDIASARGGPVQIPLAFPGLQDAAPADAGALWRNLSPTIARPGSATTDNLGLPVPKPVAALPSLSPGSSSPNPTPAPPPREPLPEPLEEAFGLSDDLLDWMK